MKRAHLSFALLTLFACATVPPRPGDPLLADDTRAGWQALAEGRQQPALEAFERRLAGAKHDGAAHLGAFAVTYARGDSAAALAHALAIFEAVASDAAPPAFAAAAATPLPDLLDEAGDDATIARLDALVGARSLPWSARLGLVQSLDDWRRREGDRAALQHLASRAGCVSSAVFRGPLGRLPHGDLKNDFGDSGDAQPVAASGCRLWLSAREARAGVMVVTAEITAKGEGPHVLVLDHPGEAAVRVDGGAWHSHGSLLRHAPAWSAVPVVLAPGLHRIEVRLASYDGAALIRLALMPLRAGDDAPAAPPGKDAPLSERALHAFADGLATALVKDGDAMQGAAERLRGLPDFTVGAVLAGWLLQADESRPTHLARDRARGEYQRALARDESLARPWWWLAELELADGRSRDAIRLAERAAAAAPAFWPALHTLAAAFTAAELERPADQALDRALAVLAQDPRGHRGCAVIESAAARARRRLRVEDEESLATRAAACDGRSLTAADFARTRGLRVQAAQRFERAAALSFPDEWVAAELASHWLTDGELDAAESLLRERLRRSPREPGLRVRLADALWARGNKTRATALIAEGLTLTPASLELRQAARALGVPRPLADHRVDGPAVVRAFARSGRSYDAPAVVVLDRMVESVQADGTVLALTHNIVRVQSKDGIDRWGEVQVPADGEVLTLRTIKADGRTLEPEDIVGKETVSAPELAVGDFVEWETLEWRSPVEAFAPGFIGSRFFFRSFEAPLDRSEYLLVTPDGVHEALQIDRRAGAPVPSHERLADGRWLTRFAVTEAAQVFIEAASVPVRDFVPSVRVSAGVDLTTWQRYLGERFIQTARTSPDIERLARTLAHEAGDDPRQRLRAMVRWVGKNIEAESGIDESATATLARGRGNRLALLMALSRALDLEHELVLARSLFTAEADAEVMVQDLEDFAQPLLAFDIADTHGPVFVDARLRHAPAGYLPPGLDGAPLLCACADGPKIARGRGRDRRRVQLDARIDAEGAATVAVDETLAGLPALEWAETMERIGRDQDKLRREFEERWLSGQFPGAVLDDLQITLPGQGGDAQMKYSFTLPQFALRRDDGLVITPVFFQSQPGRRFASEPRRKTPLFISYEVPIELEARLHLPAGASVLDVGDSQNIVAPGVPGLRFLEARTQAAGRGGEGPVVTIKRTTAVPIARVSPARYPALGAELRKVDPAQASLIRVRLGAAVR